jgi:hypothetical protein
MGIEQAIMMVQPSVLFAGGDDELASPMMNRGLEQEGGGSYTVQIIKSFVASAEDSLVSLLRRK